MNTLGLIVCSQFVLFRLPTYGHKLIAKYDPLTYLRKPPPLLKLCEVLTQGELYLLSDLPIVLGDVRVLRFSFGLEWRIQLSSSSSASSCTYGQMRIRPRTVAEVRLASSLC